MWELSEKNKIVEKQMWLMTSNTQMKHTGKSMKAKMKENKELTDTHNMP